MSKKLFNLFSLNISSRVAIIFLLIGFNSLNAIQAQEINIDSASELRIKRFSIQIHGGIGHLTANTKDDKASLISQGISNPEALKYYEDLNSGYLLQGVLYYRINPKWSIGVENQIFYTQSSISGSILMNNNNIAGDYSYSDSWDRLYGLIKENIYTNYTGLSLKRNITLIKDVFNGYTSLSMGWIFYRNEYNNVILHRLLTGNTPALNLQTGFEIKISKSIGWNINASYLASYLFKMKINNGKKVSENIFDRKDIKNISRVNLTTGLNFYF